MTQGKQTRRGREERRAEIVLAARGLFLDRAYDQVGMTEVAAAGVVSRQSAYRYFPGGRPEVFVAVAEKLVDELRERLRHAGEGPFSPAKRMEHLLAALFGYFTAYPAAFRILFQDVWALRDPAVSQAVVAARAPLAAEIADIVASTGGTADDVLLLSTGILGATLANVELVLARTVDGEAAWAATCTLARAALSE
jgi:AcrR family transcriptional regulator